MSSKKVSKEDMLDEYLSLQLQYVDFTNYVENIIKNLLIENNIKYQAISSRVKSYDSLEKKLTTQMIDGIHKNIKNLSDLSGIRIIFYDEAELNNFRILISNYFKDVKYKYPEDITRYDGTNITVSVDKKVSKFNGMKCEIQLTTLLSHAINEFGHDIIYKDIDELKSKDLEEYNKIEDIFKTIRNDILKIRASLEVINRRVQSIKVGSKNIELLLGDNINEVIDKSNNFSDIEEIMQKMIDIIPLVNKDSNKYQKISNLGIISKIVNKFSELPHDETFFLSYDNYEYKYTKLLEFLQRYKYLWMDDLKNILVKLYDISKNSDLIGRYDKFIENLMNLDKANSVKGLAHYNIHSNAFLLISDNKVDNHIRLKLAECYCNLDFSYCEEAGMDKISFVNGKLKISNEYRERIYQVIEIILEMLLKSYSEEVLRAIININYCLESNANIFDDNPIYDFFYVHYNKINIYSKNKLYDSLCIRKESKFRGSKFYNRIKKDKVQMVYAMLFNYHIEDPIGEKYSVKEKYRNTYLSDFIINFNEEDEKCISLILDSLDLKGNNIDRNHGGKWLFNIGYETEYGKRILNNNCNEYILLGLVKKDKDYIPIIEDNESAIRIIKAMSITKEIDNRLLDILINISEESKEVKIELLKLISNNEHLNTDNKYKSYFLSKISEYNSASEGIIGDILFNVSAEKEIIKKYKKAEINVLLKNYRYCNFTHLDEFFLNDLFEKYPESLRKLFKWKAINFPQTDLFNSYNFADLSSCNNFNKELPNNLDLCIEIMKNQNHYYKSNYIRYLLGKYDENIEKTIIDYLNINNDINNFNAIIKICRIFDVSLSCWKIYEEIISKIDSNDKLLDEIDCNLFDGVFTGEDGLTKAYYEKYCFFKKIKSKDDKVIKFAKREAENYKVLYHGEKNRRQKDKIIRESKYKIEKTA